jgi:hypothetical protein
MFCDQTERTSHDSVLNVGGVDLIPSRKGIEHLDETEQRSMCYQTQI